MRSKLKGVSCQHLHGGDTDIVNTHPFPKISSTLYLEEQKQNHDLKKKQAEKENKTIVKLTSQTMSLVNDIK